MELKSIEINVADYPEELQAILSGAKLFDSSCSEAAEVIFIDKDDGYFLKKSAKGTLENENAMTNFFHKKGLAAQVLSYISNENDWLLTTKVQGEDGISQKHLEQPERLVDLFAMQLRILHGMDYCDCPIKNRTGIYLDSVKKNYLSDNYDKSQFPDSWGYSSAEEAYKVVENKGHLLKTDTLLHGDYCLPNIIFENWKFSGYIDVDNGGVGDRHIDIFWGIWTLCFNMKTNKYRDRFIDVYGRDKVDEEILRIVAAAEVFG